MFKRLGKDTIIYGGGDLGAKLIAFFTFPLIASALSPKAFGALELVTTAVALVGMIVNCGLNNALQRFYWDEHTQIEKRPVLVSTGMLFQLILGVIVFALGCLGIPLITELIFQAELPMGLVAIVSAFLLVPALQWIQFILDVTRLHHKPVNFLVISFLSRVINALAAVYVVCVLGKGIDGLLLVQVLVSFAVIPIALWLIRKDLTNKVDRMVASELIKFGFPFIFVSIAYWLFSSMDRWMLASLASVEEIGIYSVAFRFSSIIFFISTAFGQAWSPYAIKIKTDRPNKYRSVYTFVLSLILFIMLIIGGGLAIFSGEVIALIMPVEYVGSALPLSILCFGVILQATQQVTAIGISLEKRTYLFARLAWLTAIVNFVGNWYLIPLYGAVGAAWATTLSYFVLTGSYLYFTQRLHPLPISKKSIGWLLMIGASMAVVSINFNVNYVDTNIILLKIFFIFVCILLALPALQLKKVLNYL